MIVGTGSPESPPRPRCRSRRARHERAGRDTTPGWPASFPLREASRPGAGQAEPGFEEHYDRAGNRPRRKLSPRQFTPRAEKDHKPGRRPPVVGYFHRLGGGDSFAPFNLLKVPVISGKGTGVVEHGALHDRVPRRVTIPPVRCSRSRSLRRAARAVGRPHEFRRRPSAAAGI